jgi:hypothetical protein
MLHVYNMFFFEASYFHCNIKAEINLDTIHNDYTPCVASVRATDYDDPLLQVWIQLWDVGTGPSYETVYTEIPFRSMCGT